MFEKEAKEFKERTQKQYEEMQRNGAMPSLWANLDNIWKDGAEFGYKKLRDQVVWRVDEPPKNKKIELLCVLFDEDEYRTLKKNEWSDGYNRFIVTGTWNGAYFRGEIDHASGDPFPESRSLETNGRTKPRRTILYKVPRRMPRLNHQEPPETVVLFLIIRLTIPPYTFIVVHRSAGPSLRRSETWKT